MPPAKLYVAPTNTGVCIRVEGQATMRQSAAAKDLATRTLAGGPAATVVFDLSNCDYLDSTFLGCLMDLYRMHGQDQPKRYSICAPPPVRVKLLGSTHLDRLIPILDSPPSACGAWIEVPVESTNPVDLVRHVMECHEALATVDCPSRDLFARIATQMRSELSKLAN